MSLIFILGLNTGKLIQAVCWTLVHSVWQGLVLTIAAFMVISLTRRSGPAVRYNLLTGLFILFVVTSCATLVHEIQVSNLSSSLPAPNAASDESAGISGQTLILTQVSAESKAGYLQNLIVYLNEHAFIIVAIWFIIFAIKLVRIISNISYIQRIRRHRTFSPLACWKQKVNDLARSLGIQNSFELLESAIVQAPMVVGFLKPVILTPLGLLANLPNEQVEAILLHELAHIRRKDYFINLLQSFMEVVFFFNPGALWVSSLMREERENCCDDITIGCTNNKKEFIHALVAFQEYQIQQSLVRTNIGFAGQKKYLLNRVKRLVYNENKKLNAMEKGIFIFSIAAIGFIGFASLTPSPRKIPASVQSSAAKADPLAVVKLAELADTVPGTPGFKKLSSVLDKEGNSETKTITGIDNDGKRYKIVMKDQEPMELNVDDKKIPSGELENYKEIITSMEEGVEMRQKDDVIKMKMATAQQELQLKQLDQERLQLLQRLSSIDHEKAELKDKKPNDHEWSDAAASNWLSDMKAELLTKDLFKQEQLAGALFQDKQALLGQRDDANWLLEKTLADKNSSEFMEKGLLDKSIFDNKNQNADFQLQELGEKLGSLRNGAALANFDQFIQPIVLEMIEEGILPANPESFSFELDKHKFIVNGKAEPKEIQEKFQQKFVKKDGASFKYSKNNGNISSSVNLN